MAKNSTLSMSALDEARRELCKSLVASIQEGDVGLQVRFLRNEEEVSEAWIYTRKEHEWTKRNDLTVSQSLLQPMCTLLEGLSRQEFTDPWMIRRTSHSDRIDFELKFHRDAIEPHLNRDLESFLIGCLSHGQHDSGKDARRRIRFQGW